MASSTHRSITVAFVTLTLLTTGLAALVPTSAADHAGEEGVMTVEGADGALIEILVCKPDVASETNPVPVILHSHGWGGARDDACDDTWLSQDWGYVSVTQRGFGNSEGEAHVHDPDFEGIDNTAVIDEIASFSWVETEDEADDPFMAAVGGSYGGGYQYLTALLETHERADGEPRLDALAPEITWYDLPQSLAPNEVIRSVWVDALYAAGAANVHQGIHEAFLYGTATGQLPDDEAPVYDIVGDFHENSPVGWVDQGVHLDIPVVMRQGITDNLFNLNQGIHNFENTLSSSAQEKSLFFGYNGGHALPNVLPLGTTARGDPCTSAYDGGWDQLRVDFFQAAFDDEATTGDVNPRTEVGFSKPYHLATDGGDCLPLDSVDADTVTAPGMIDVAATTTGAGPVQQIPIAEGPLTVAGIPTFDATLTSAGVDQRAFLGLAVGTTPADAQVLSNNLMPVRSELPALQEDVSTELPGVAVDLAEDETLYLTVTPTSDMFAHHGSRTPGGMLFEDVSVTLPVVE